MSLRITQGIIFSQSLRDIQRSLLGTVKLQQQIASGLRVNRPSDDPAATLRILPLKSDLRRLDLMIENTNLAKETLNTGAASLEDASAIIQRVRELAIQGANGTVSAGDRASLGQEIDQILQQMVSVANAQRGGRFLFGGTVTNKPPFALITGPNGSRVEYRGNLETLTVDVAPGVQTALNIPGSDIFLNKDREVTNFAGSTGAVPGTGTFTGKGADTVSISFAGLNIPAGVVGIAQGTGTTTALGNLSYTYVASPPTLSINGGVATPVTAGEQELPVGKQGSVISLNLSLPITPATGTLTSTANLSIDGGLSNTLVDFTSNELQVTDSISGNEVSVDVSALTITGEEQVAYGGIFDLFETLITIRDLLQNADGNSQSSVSNALSSSLGKLDKAHENLLDGLRGLGFRSQNMSLIQNRVEGLRATSQEALSLSRDTDIVSAIVEFNEANTIYQAALQVGARVVQISLLNFLR